MSAPDPDSVSLAAKVLAGASALVAPVWGAYVWLDSRFAKKIEVDRHRDYFIKTFEKMESHEKLDTERFANLMEKMHENHAELLRALGTKEDR